VLKRGSARDFVFFTDGDMEWEEEMAYPPSYSPPSKDGDDDFDNLLQQAQRKLRHN